MRVTTLIPLALLALLAGTAAAIKPAAPTLDGTWTAATAELAGKPFPGEILKKVKLVVKGDAYKVTVGEQVDEGTVKVDATTTPKQLDVTGVKGPNQGRTIQAIWELQGDTLRVCYDLGGTGRPAEMKTAEGTQYFLVTYKRAKAGR